MHGSVERKPTAVLPGAHRLRVFALEQSAPGSHTQQTPVHLGLDVGDGLKIDAAGFVKARAARAIGLENSLDDGAMEVDVGIEQRAEAVDEGHRADA